MTPDLLDELAVLVQASLDRSLTPVQFSRLEHLLEGSSRARLHYMELLITQVALRGGETVAESATVRTPVGRWAAGIAAGVLLAVGLAWWWVAGPEPRVARVTERIDAVWSEDPESHALEADRTYHLQSGVVKVELSNRVWAILEGPADFNMITVDRMSLTRGKLFVHVPASARGFRVLHPGGEVIDRGTEFGIEVAPAEDTWVQVYQGKVDWIDLQSHTESLEQHQAYVLRADGSGARASFEPEHFVRQINDRFHLIWQGENLNVADIVGGGYGLGDGSLNFGFDTASGDMVKAETFKALAGPGGYHETGSHPFVDGVFVPGADAEGCPVSSTLLNWPDCPATTGRTWGGMVFNGAWFGDAELGVPRHSWSLGGKAYGCRNRSAIAMHSNAGITFDLDAIRQAIDGMDIQQFRSQCGISETFFNYYRRSSQLLSGDLPHAAVQVLVDGKERFGCADLTPLDRSLEISVDLTDSDRFLTLVVTEGKDRRIDFDWVLFAQPTLMTSRPRLPAEQEHLRRRGSMESYWREYQR